MGLALPAAGVLAACDTRAPLPINGDGDGFGPASLHVFLGDSTGAHRAGGWTCAIQLAPGDSVRQGFTLFVRQPDGMDAEHDVGLTYTIDSGSGSVRRLTSQCEPYTGVGTWVRLGAEEALERGAFETAAAVP